MGLRRAPVLLTAFLLAAAFAGSLVAPACAPAVVRPSAHITLVDGIGPVLSSGPSDTAADAPISTSLAPATTQPEATAVATTTAPPDRSAVISLSIGYRVRIARLGIDLSIAEGNIERDTIDQRTPEGYAFHLPGTSLPGHAGNTYLYAHARVGMFLSLWNARVGDEVVVTAPGGVTLVYVVREVRPRVAPADVSVVGNTADERLTLQTSTGPKPQDPRFVVIAFPRSQSRGRGERFGDDGLVM